MHVETVRTRAPNQWAVVTGQGALWTAVLKGHSANSAILVIRNPAPCRDAHPTCSNIEFAVSAYQLVRLFVLEIILLSLRNGLRDLLDRPRDTLRPPITRNLCQFHLLLIFTFMFRVQEPQIRTVFVID